MSKKAKYVPPNKGQCVGPKSPFTPQQVQALVKSLKAEGNWRELAIFMVAIDSMLRSCDLQTLRVGDVFERTGKPFDYVRLRQRKTHQSVFPVLTPQTISALEKWITDQQKQSGDFLFTSRKAGREHLPLSTSALRRIVKGWAERLELDPTHYSAHSLRRTKPTHLYRSGVRIELITELLGHKDVKSTMRYLGIDRHEAQEVAGQFDVFRASPADSSEAPEVSITYDQMERLADLVAEKLRN